MFRGNANGFFLIYFIMRIDGYSRIDISSEQKKYTRFIIPQGKASSINRNSIVVLVKSYIPDVTSFIYSIQLKVLIRYS